MDKQPEALRLADLIRSRYGNDINDEAAAELRRLHTLNQELLEALEWYVQNDDVLEEMPGNEYWVEGLNKARAAIAKAKEQT